MPSQNGNGGPWGSGAKSSSDLEDLVRQGQDRLNQIMQPISRMMPSPGFQAVFVPQPICGGVPPPAPV